ncbi:MAG: cell wall anchor protein [Bacteroides sp.]|nr:cell wall anchor protein [Bacteroides sp.]
MKRIASILIGTAIAATIATTGADRQVAVKASLDSASLVMGRQTTLHLEVVGPIGEEGDVMLPDSIWQEVEVRSVGEPKYTDLGNGRRQMLRDIILQSFDSGVYTLPPVLYIDGSDTFISNRPVVKVLPVAVDTLKTVHDYADVVNPKRQILDYVPDWMADYGLWILLCLIAVGAGIYVYLRYKKQGRILPMPVKREEPPYEMAIRQLDELKGESLCERGEEKQYYTRLTDILRVYLQRRFGINAMEMTTTQIRHALHHNEETRLSEKQLSKVLEMADFVKFAKVRPLPDDNIAAMRSAVQFVEETKPAPVAEDSEKEEHAEKAKDNKKAKTN